ncbi:hypothetical protein K432DRAFT_323880 [Lepidopterella palustris CBS 459.81]|uniref:superoxide dismutase n=1 Tax=Lepidopterella palustris CBS 459.81 TaxID=1314670 RepID=A0A8E2EEV1_9PEZI|nr:hypothetical protein K432DRAFT_323880 [Lepidopterella palustris CBS 459.81]
MRSSTILSAFVTIAIASAQTTGQLGDAQVITNNPRGASSFLDFPRRVDTTIYGGIWAQTSNSGKGVDFSISINGLPAEGGPFLYHIHEAQVPEDGNCTATGAHLDPYLRGETPPCDSTEKQTCQVGDLSGKYGKIANVTAYTAIYTDQYTSFVPTSGAYIGNRSIVIHFANKTRITCANFISAHTGYESVITPPSPPSTASAGIPSASSNGTSPTSSPIATGAESSGASGSATATPPSPPKATQSGNAAALGMWMSSGAALAGLMAMVL